MIRKLGILGDGQLAKMLIEAGDSFDIDYYVFGEDPQGPCQGIAKHVYGSYQDSEALDAFFSLCDLVSFENEFFDPELLSKYKSKCIPYLSSFSLIENKYVEKQTAASSGLKVLTYRLLSNIQVEDPSSISFPCVLKQTKGSYDGIGTYVVNDIEQWDHLLSNMVKDKSHWMVEDYISFDKEVAICFARSRSGNFAFYPLVDSIQKNNKCVRVDVPSSFKYLETIAQQECVKLAEALNYVGLMSVEFFVKNDQLYFNECAPRAHNSAHYTMDMFPYSQFDLQLCCLLDKKLPSLVPNYKWASMINILGTQEGKPDLKLPDCKENYFVHIYNKKQSRLGRKMGHINFVGDDFSKIQEACDLMTEGIKI